MYSAKVIEHSIHPQLPNNHLVSVQMRYPRFIHSELMTHRAFSRNASSSRAIPVSRMIEEIMRDTAMPIHWGKNQKGMQADEEIDEVVRIGTSPPLKREEAWLEARDWAIEIALAFDEAGYHKQIVNRLLEPFMHISVIVTSNSWNNFFALRCHKDAQPEIQTLACLVRDAIADSFGKTLEMGEWHLPYTRSDERNSLDLDTLKKVSVARCARVSYMTHDGVTPSIESDVALFERLVGSTPLHASPAEHQASPDRFLVDARTRWAQPDKHGNLTGWLQNRKFMPHEFVPG